MRRKQAIAIIVTVLSCLNAAGNFFYPRFVAIVMGILMALAGILNLWLQRVPAIITLLDEDSGQEWKAIFGEKDDNP